MQGDVLLFQTDDGGNISLTNGQIDMTTGLETAVYLSLFSPEDWFLNDIAETDDEKLSSETNKIIDTLPNVSGNYSLLEQANLMDLQWLIDNDYANEVTSSVSSDAINRVNIQINVDKQILNFSEGWNTNGN